MRNSTRHFAVLATGLFAMIFAAATSRAQNVLTRQNDIGRTGRQLNENTLTTGNVNASTFGKVFTYTATGQIYAQPLTVANLNVSGCHASPHCNVVYVATENDMLYAFDADGASGSLPLWSVDLAAAVGIGYTYVACTNVYSGCNSNSALYPNIGVTGTPVIDTNTNTLYVVGAVFTPAPAGLAGIFDYIHAINILTGAEKFGGPFRISASVTGYALPLANCATGTTGGTVYFNAGQQLQRPGLLELSASATGYTHPVIYIGFSIYDGNPSASAGWILGYDANTLAQVTAFNTTPFGTGGGIWASGQGLAAAVNGSTTYIYAPTADGTFDITAGGTDYGDSMLKLAITNGVLTVGSYFTPSDQLTRCQHDIDFGSGGVMILPDVSVTGHTNLMVSASKGSDGTTYLTGGPSLWVIDRDTLGGLQTTGTPVQQAHTAVTINGHPAGGYWTSPAYYEWGTNNSSKAIYYTMTLPNTTGVAPNPLNQYILNSTDPIPNDGNGNAVPTNSTLHFFCAPVPTPSISATPSNTNGILWVVENSNSHNPTDCLPFNASGAILHAYDATNVHSAELYNSGSHIQANTPTKFVPPTVFNGRVYVSTYQGLTLGGTTGELDVFGLCNGSCIQ